MKGKMTFGDKLALIKMSMRSFFWDIDGNATFKNLGFLFKFFIFFAVGACFVDSWFGIIGNIIPSLRGPFAYYSNTFGPANTFSNRLSNIFMHLIILAIGHVILFNFDKLKYNLNFKNSTFYKNTECTPSEIISDKGLYGEYIATISAEKLMKKCDAKGRVFNNVMIPQNGGSFTEADIVMVSEIGIHVIEVKAITGNISGNYGDTEWTQKLGTQVNEFTNPLYQNMNHCNYLLEYLGKKFQYIPAFEKGTVGSMYNVIIFTSNNVELNISDYTLPNIDYVYVGSDVAYKRFGCGKIYSEEFTEALCNEVEKIASYSKAERQEMFNEREMRRERGELSYPTKYSIVRATTAVGEGFKMGTCLCQQYNGYTFYLDIKDNWYKSFPNMHIDEVYESYNNIGDALTAFNSKEYANIKMKFDFNK